MEKNYMLLITTDRTIDAICFFETHEEAYQTMLSDFAECVDETIPNLIQMRDINENEDWFFDDNSARSNLHNTDVDWVIIDLEKAREKDRVTTVA